MPVGKSKQSYESLVHTANDLKAFKRQVLQILAPHLLPGEDVMVALRRLICRDTAGSVGRSDDTPGV